MLLWHWENTVLKVSFGPYIDAPLPAVIEQASLFMTAYYGQKSDTMSNARLTAWAAKTGKGQVSTPRLCSLPLTTEGFVENVKRAHHQASIWRSAKEEPELDVEKYGRKKDDVNRSLVPTTIPETVNLAPDSVQNSSDVGVKVAHFVTHQGVVAGVRIFHVRYFALVMMEDVAMRMSHNYCRQ